MKNNYTKEEIKKIIKEIFEEEKNKTNISIKGLPVTIIEYYQSDNFKKNLKLTEPLAVILKTVTPIKMAGWFNSETKEIIVMIKEKKINSKKYGLGKVIKNTYHEIRHHYQNEKIMSQNGFIPFLMKIESEYKETEEGYINYMAEHGSYLVEIDANMNGVKKALEYVKRDPKLYRQNIKYLESMEKKYQKDVSNYNPYKTFDKCHCLMTKNPNDTLKSIPVLNYFYNEIGTFKSLREILIAKTKIDNDIVNLVITSNPFLKQIKYDDLAERDRIDLIMTLKEEYSEIIKSATSLIPVKEETKNIMKKIYIFLNRKTKKQELASEQEHLETINKFFLEGSKNRKK